MLEPTDSGVAERWRALWDASPQRSPFSRLEYVRAIAQASGLTVGIFFATSNEGDEAGAALTWRRQGPYREVIVPPLTPFSGILLADPVREADVHARNTPLESLLSELEKAFHHTRLHLPPAMTDVRPAQWRAWAAQPLYTYRVADPGRDRWSRSTSRNFQAARQAYSLVEGSEAASAAIRLAADSYGRSDRALPIGTLSVRSLVDALDAGGLVRAYGVRRRDADEIEAAVIVASEGSCGFYWLAGSVPGNAMTVLVGEMLPVLFEQGIETFDFVGANTPSIAEFKRRFGAELVPYFSLKHFTRIDLKLLYAFRKMLRR